MEYLWLYDSAQAYTARSVSFLMGYLVKQIWLRAVLAFAE